MAEDSTSSAGEAASTGVKKRAQKSREGRKNAAAACDSCRRKRTRCIPSETEGGSCQGCTASQLECQYTGHDRRRGTVQDLRTKLSQFEQLFSSIGSSPSLLSSLGPGVADVLPEPNAIPINSHNNQGEDTNSNSMYDASRERSDSRNKRARLATASPPGTSFTMPDFMQSNPSISPIHTLQTSSSLSPGSAASFAMPPLPHPSANVPSSAPSSSIVSVLPRMPSHPSAAETTPLIADCLAIEQGEIRAYGPTSNQTLAAENPRTSGQAVHTTDKQGDRRVPCPPAMGGLPTDRSALLVAAAKNIDMVPLGTDIRTVEHLIYMYFTWHHIIFPIMSAKIFLDHFQKGGNCSSPLLLNSILALASHLSDWKLVRSDPNDAATTGATFFARAKTLLDEELENPSVTTVQALCLMAKYEAYHGRALKGGLYVAMCGRLVLDLGLHLDPTHLVQRKVISGEVAWLRARTFWGVWSVDKEFSALVGRPSAIRGVLITCPKPEYWPDEDIDWEASYSSKSLVAAQHHERGSFYIAEFAIDMAGVHLRSMDQMYWREHKPSLEENMAALEVHMLATREAMSTLPSVTPKGEITNPHILTLHMVYNCHIIILNRPFLFAAGQNKGSNAVGEDFISVSRDRCFDSAREIVRLMDKISDATPNGLHTTLNCHQHNLVTAAAILIMEVTSSSSAERLNLAREDLFRIFNMLQIMSVFRPAAKQALDNLRDLYSTTETQSTLVNMAASHEASTGQTVNGTSWERWNDSAPVNNDLQVGTEIFDYEAISGFPFDFPSAYLYPTLACSDLFDTSNFFQTQLIQSRPSSRNGYN